MLQRNPDTDINEIIIHCTGTKEGEPLSAEGMRRRAQRLGLEEVAYHYVIQPDGTVEACRPLECEGAHCPGHNARSIGIAYVGGRRRSGVARNTLNAAQERALVELIRELYSRFPLIRCNLHGHNEFSLDRCPCFDVQELRHLWGV